MEKHPFKISEKVSGNIVVEKIETTIRDYDKEKLRWHNSIHCKYLTLDEILNQIIERSQNKETPFLRIEYETGDWGVIFEIGNDTKMPGQWIVHGITKGYRKTEY